MIPKNFIMRNKFEEGFIENVTVLVYSPPCAHLNSHQVFLISI